jgi:hypothetical protein
LAPACWGSRRRRGLPDETGNARGEFTQTCVVSIEPFDATLDEPVDARFAPRREEESTRRPARETLTLSVADEDDPDPVIDHRIGLGALTAEIFALGLDPIRASPEWSSSPRPRRRPPIPRSRLSPPSPPSDRGGGEKAVVAERKDGRLMKAATLPRFVGIVLSG